MNDKVLVSESNLAAIADAIRAKTGTTTKYKPVEMASAISGITTGGDTTKEDELVTRTITTYENDRVTSVGYSTFYNCSALTSVNLPAAETIGVGAFYSCSALTSVNLPAAETIGNNAFGNCSSLTSVNLPAVKTIGYNAFYNCQEIKTVVIGDDTSDTMCSVSDNAFGNMHADCVITVPHQLWDAYLANSKWARYKSHLRPSDHDLDKITVTVPNSFNVYGTADKTTVYETAAVTYNEANNCPESQMGVTWSVSGNATVDSAGKVTLTDAAAVGDTITVTATSTYNTAITATATISVVSTEASISIAALTPDGAWIDSGSTVNDHTVYKSDAGSYHVANGTSKAQITFKGYTQLTIYCKQNSENNYDYVDVGPLDGTVSRDASTNILSLKGVASDTWKSTTVTTDIGTHTIEVLYSKDSSGDIGDDRGYFYVVGEL